MKKQRLSRNARPKFDFLEDRQMLAATVYTVLNLNATGTGSLAAAISSANHQTGNPDGSAIQFVQGLNGMITTPTTLDLSETDGPEQIIGNNAVTISGGNTVGVFSVAPTTVATFTNLTVTGGNTTNNGGGILLGTNGVRGSNVTITNCTVSNNTTTAVGGGIFVNFYGNLTVINSTIANNTASGGGGILNLDGIVVISGSTIANNTATGIGQYLPNCGGINNNGPYGSTANSPRGILNISNSTIVGNTSHDGAGIYADGGFATVTNSTIANNHATNPTGLAGAGIYAYNGQGQPGYSSLPSIVINNTIIVNNIDTAAGIAGTADDLAGGSSIGSYNLVGSDRWSTLANNPGNQVGITNPGLGVLANNGGSTQTIALFAGSPAIGAGSVTLAVSASGQSLTTDQIGNSRITNGHVDIGAYELQSNVVTVPPIPINLVATANSSTITLNWAASTGATSYNVYRSTTSGTEGSTPYRTSVTTTSFTDTGLTNGTRYYYQVTAVNTAGESNKSSEVSATPTSNQLQLITAVNAGGGVSGSYLADTGFTGGNIASTAAAISTSGVTNPASQAVYQTERYGNFTYTTSGLTAGASYTVRLHFAEFYWTAAGQRVFNVLINGTQVLSNFDILAAAGGRNIAIVEQFTAVADVNGRIAVQFVTVRDNAKLSGLEIFGASSTPITPSNVQATPAGSGQVTLNWAASTGATSYNIYRSTTSGTEGSAPYRTSVTTTSFTDTGLTNGTRYYYQVTAVNTTGESNKSSEVSATANPLQLVTAVNAGGGVSGSYLADTSFTGGNIASTAAVINTSGVTSPASQAVYQTERYGNFTYTTSGLTAGASYTVRLHFAEFYWTAVGQRVFNVLINGVQVLTNFDILAVAGGRNIAIVEQFTAVADVNGRIAVQFVTVRDNAKLSGLEIFSV